TFTTPLLTADTSYWVSASDVPPTNVTAQVGDGTSTNAVSGTFLYHGWGGYKHQYIFTAAELTAAGLGTGYIEGLQFEVATLGTPTYKNFSIALGTTTQNAATTSHIDNTLLTQVYSNALETFTSGDNTLTFTTPYFWDGISNLVVQTNWSNENNSGSGTGGNTALVYHTTSPNMTTETHGDIRTAAEILVTNTGGVLNALGVSSGGTTTQSARPNTVFIATLGCNSNRTEVKVEVEPKPAFELSTDKLVSCENGTSSPVTITTNLGGYDTFVWMPSTGVSGDEVNGWTFTTTHDQDYVLSASQSNGICEHLKTVRVLAAQNPEPVSTLANNYDLCKDDIQELKALEPIPSSVSIGVQGATTTPTSPISAFVQSAVYSKQQYIYSAAELIAQGVNTSGYITSLSLETINSGAALSNAQYTVKMMLTPNTSFGSNDFETGNLRTVFSAENYAHSFQGVQTISFDNPFYWDGQSNILVEITQEGLGSGNNAQTYYNTVTGTNVGMYATSGTEPNPLVGIRTNDRLNVTFSLEQSKVTWSPTNNLYLDAATT